MSALLVTVLRFGFLILLWLFVLLVVVTIRRDVFGTRVADRSGSRPAKQVRRKRHAETPTAGSPQRSHQRSHDARLVVIAGPLTGTTIPLTNGSVTVGRSPDSALVLDDGFASSRHARFYNDGGEIYIEDLNSTNGTWVGRERIYAPTHLVAGSQVTIGKTTMEIQR